MPRTSRRISVTLGDLQDGVDRRVKSGAYSSASEGVRAGLRALDREEAAVNDWLRQRVQDALDDPRPGIPARTVFKRLRRVSAELNAGKGEKA